MGKFTCVGRKRTGKCSCCSLQEDLAMRSVSEGRRALYSREVTRDLFVRQDNTGLAMHVTWFEFTVGRAWSEQQAPSRFLPVLMLHCLIVSYLCKGCLSSQHRRGAREMCVYNTNACVFTCVLIICVARYAELSFNILLSSRGAWVFWF